MKIISHVLFAVVFLQLTACGSSNQETQSTMQPTSQSEIPQQFQDTATVGGGCFWCTEAQFQLLDGVVSVKSGYSGGTVKNPAYKEVCNGTTGHAEVIQVVFDNRKLTYTDILQAFWASHDPTQLNRQGNDIGTQYRSVIFYHDDSQKKTAEELKAALNSSGAYDDEVVTEISAFSVFYPAESYHQNYFNENGDQPYCRFVVAPKVEKFKKVFKERLKK